MWILVCQGVCRCHWGCWGLIRYLGMSLIVIVMVIVIIVLLMFFHLF